MPANQRSPAHIKVLFLTAFMTTSTAMAANAQAQSPFRLYLPLTGVGIVASDMPRPPTAQPTTTSTSAPSPTPSPIATATETELPASPTPTDIPATATNAPLPSRITGRVTSNGQPMAPGIGAEQSGPQIELHRRERGVWQKVASTAVLEDGRFVFEGPTPLRAGDAYSVWWELDPNLFNTEWLTRWMSRNIETFGADSIVDLGSFDVADTIMLLKPDNYWWNTLPLSFTWRDTASLVAGFRWTLARRCGDNSNDIDRDDVFRTASLGRKTSFKLDGLPPGFSYGKYCWYVTVEDGIGGMGWSQQYRHIEFRAMPLLALPGMEGWFPQETVGHVVPGEQ